MTLQTMPSAPRKTRPGQMEQVGARRTCSHLAGGVRQKYVLDDRGRRLIEGTYDGKGATIDRLVKLLGVPRWKIKKWATDLGLVRHREPRWTQEDIDYLEWAVSRKSIADIAAHLGRTKTAVKVKMKRTSIAKSDDGYTLRRLCECLGCDHHAVERWIAKGMLRGTRRHSERTEQVGDMWLFTDEHVKQFIMRYPNEVDQRRVAWIWVVDLLSGGLGELS